LGQKWHRHHARAGREQDWLSGGDNRSNGLEIFKKAMPQIMREYLINSMQPILPLVPGQDIGEIVPNGCQWRFNLMGW
jgi:hypothetical protein